MATTGIMMKTIDVGKKGVRVVFGDLNFVSQQFSKNLIDIFFLVSYTVCRYVLVRSYELIKTRLKGFILLCGWLCVTQPKSVIIM